MWRCRVILIKSKYYITILLIGNAQPHSVLGGCKTRVLNTFSWSTKFIIRFGRTRYFNRNCPCKAWVLHPGLFLAMGPTWLILKFLCPWAQGSSVYLRWFPIQEVKMAFPALCQLLPSDHLTQMVSSHTPRPYISTIGPLYFWPRKSFREA